MSQIMDDEFGAGKKFAQDDYVTKASINNDY
jgi:hypothetical protein